MHKKTQEERALVCLVFFLNFEDAIDYDHGDDG